MAILLSVTLVLIFGEILPSAIFTGPKRLRIASAMHCVLWFVVSLFFLIAAPISILLDKLLGKNHGLRFQRSELKEFIKLHSNIGDDSEGLGNTLDGSKIPLLHVYDYRSPDSDKGTGRKLTHPVKDANRHDGYMKLEDGPSSSRDDVTPGGKTEPINRLSNNTRQISIVSVNSAHLPSEGGTKMSSSAKGFLVIPSKKNSNSNQNRSISTGSSPSLRFPLAQPQPKHNTSVFDIFHREKDNEDEIENSGEKDDIESHILSPNEVKIIAGVLDLKDKAVLTRMIPIDKVFKLSCDDVVNR